MEQRRWIDFLINRYSKTLVRYAYALTKDKGRAKAIGEECLLSLLRQSPPIPRNQIEVWLFKDCRRRATSDTPCTSIFDGYFPTEELNVLNMALIGLESDQQEVIWLKYRDQLGTDDIAKVLDLSGSEVEDKLKEATKTLIQETTDLEPDEEIISHFSQSLAEELGRRARESLSKSQIVGLKNQPENLSPLHAPPANWNLVSIGSTIAATIAIVVFMLAPREPEVFTAPSSVQNIETKSQPAATDTPAPQPPPAVATRVPEELKKEFSPVVAASEPERTKPARVMTTSAKKATRTAHKPKPSGPKKMASAAKRKTHKKVRL